MDRPTETRDAQQGVPASAGEQSRAQQRAHLHQAMVRFADGDRSAFELVFSLLWPILTAFTRRSLRNSSDAEDAAQAALLKVFSRIQDFDPARDATSWALAIASYEILTVMKKRTRRREAGSDGMDVPSGAPGPEEVTVMRDMEAALEQALGRLSEEDRWVLQSQGTPMGSATAQATHRKRRQRAMDRLKEAWRRLYGTA